MFIRQFKVTCIGADSDQQGRIKHVLIAADGECWMVLRQRDHIQPVWSIGDTVGVRMLLVETALGDRCFVPHWESVGGTHPIRYLLHRPFDAVSRSWGEEVAGRWFDRSEDPPPLIQPEGEAPMLP